MYNKGFIRGALLGALTVLLIVGTVSCGMNYSGIRSVLQHAAGESEEPVDDAAVKKLELLEQLIDSYYTGDKDSTDLREGLYKGYVEGLGDPYSVYYDEEETKAMMESSSGEYSGIGAVMTQDRDNGVITILQVYPDSPAEEAGIRDNDILYKVDGEEVTGIDLTTVVGRIKGDEGTTVELAVIRGDDAKEVTVTATRRKIEAITVAHEMKEGGIGYIRVTEFDSVTTEQYRSALEDLENQEMNGLVVDLRSNPGGNLDVVVDILDLMLPEGTVVSMEEKSGEETVYSSDEEHQFRKPLAVLMNGNSASASEIYAGAIQDYDAGEIVGTQSYGKGVVQQIFDLKDGTSVKLTIAEYFPPSGRSIDGKGITPDVEVEYEPDEENPEYDNQLEKAIEVVEKML
ncbi:MAG: S41 family peptidase [Dorea sp.]|nr:S41 family peptidase [Dorea sp.]